MSPAGRLRRVREENGHTLVELLTALGLMTLVLGATLSGLDMFASTARRTELQNEAQDRARLAMDAVSGELRNIASPDAAQPSGVEKAESADIVFRSVGSRGAATGGRRVRYCLDASTPADNKLWRQLQVWASSAAPAAPRSLSCPDTAWADQRLVADRITNANRTPVAAVWSFDAASLAEITTIRTELYVDVEPARPPAETHLASAIVLRNQNRPPTADFSATVSGSHHVLLNASTARDPEGGVLTYSWYRDNNAIGTGLTLDYAAPATGTYAFTLRVHDAAGLTAISEPRTVTVS
jgi:type II secretory pathway pseudopilin PulG